MKRFRLAAVALALLLAPTAYAADEAAPRQALKVCADPNSMPLSDQNGDGYENRIAALFAERLRLPLEYTWFPQRRGFVRKTLRAPSETGEGYKCDLIIGVPASFELAITTEPYYRSTYALVFKKDAGLDDVASGVDFVSLPQQRRQSLRVGVFEQTPGAVWLAKHGMIPQIVPYITLNADPDAYPGQIIEKELLNDNIDAAILWGPIAGYFVRKSKEQHGVDLVMIPLPSEAGIQFDFPISMAVRFGDGEWKQQVERLIADNRDAIHDILKQFNVPLIDADGKPL